MYISICEVLDKRLKAAVAEQHGVEIGLNWPASVVEPLSAKIDERNAAADWQDEAALRAEIAQMREAVVKNFPYSDTEAEAWIAAKAEAEAKAREEAEAAEAEAEQPEPEQPKPKAKAKAKKEAK